MFSNRTDAGRRLARRLLSLRGESPIVLALPRGGVPVGREVAQALGAPLDVVIVRKLGVPFQPELAMGAVAEGGARWVNAAIQANAGVTDEELEALAAMKEEELVRRQNLFRGGRPLPDVAGRTVILVDDGIATGATVRAAIQAVKAGAAQRLVLAAPVASLQTLQEIRDDVDEIVCLEAPEAMLAIGEWYEDFRQVADADVVRILDASRHAEPSPQAEEVDPQEVSIPVETGVLEGLLVIPPGATGIVVFAHGSGSSRFSVRNRYVASALQSAGLATLLFDLLTKDEEADDQVTRSYRFDISLLTVRLLSATRWLASHPSTSALRVGFFGASTGAAAALAAASVLGDRVGAVVSRGGRPDLAGDSLESVDAPVLLLVGDLDDEVLALNRQALDALRCEKRLVTVPGATHLFVEPGTLDEVVRHASSWFVRHLSEGVERRVPQRDT